MSDLHRRTHIKLLLLRTELQHTYIILMFVKKCNGVNLQTTMLL